jgi:hypothetical protein
MPGASTYVVIASGSGSPYHPPTPIPRPPLVAWPQCASCPAPYAYYDSLPWPDDQPPQTRDYLRMDAWGVELEGLPVVPGASSEPNASRTRVLTYFLDRWSPDWQRRILETHAGYGYTHFLLSAADSLGSDPCPFGPGPPGAGRTLSQFVETCGLVKQYLPYVVVALGSKNFQPRDQTPQQWADVCGPIMEALLKARVVDEFMSPWEWNLWNKEGQSSIECFRWMGQTAHAGGCSFWTHYSSEVTSWQADGTDRFAFYEATNGYVDGVMYQATPVTLGWPWPPVTDAPGQRWDVGEMQARMVDTLWPFGLQGHQQKLRAFELTAIDQYTNEHPTEDEANAIGYLACCTYDDVRETGAKVWGFGNGGRRADGTRL